MNNQFAMELLALVLCVLPAIATSITISSNGNSPKVKMIGGMMVDVQKGFIPMTPKVETTTKSNYEKSRNVTNKVLNSTKLAFNERYRRLIPYMTFYYANDVAVTPTTDSSMGVEVEKAHVLQANNINANQRGPKKIIYSSQRNIPRFQGNRLAQYNIDSANPTKIFYRDGVPVYQSPASLNINPFVSEVDYDSRRFNPKHVVKSPSYPFISSTRKPYLNLYNEDTPNIRYYLAEKEHTPKYKLIPYEQTPPVQTVPQKEPIYEVRKPVIVSTMLVPKELHVKPRPVRPPVIFSDSVQHVRKPPAIISESYYEKRPQQVAVEPAIESGFRPIITPAEYTTAPPIYTSVQPETSGLSDFEHQERPLQLVKPIPEEPIADQKPNYYQYVVDKPQYTPPEQTSSNTVTLASLLNSLQLNKSIPKPITRENVASSIKTLLQVLNVLKSVEHPNEPEGPVLSTPKPFIAPKVVVELNKLSNNEVAHPDLTSPDLDEEPYLAEVDTPSQHLDERPLGGGTSQQFPLPVTSDDEGGTPGRPGVDYPVLTTIPPTSFDCKTQRYKGFFADTETRCQVWHYCDLNGGQASFLCPNGTIFSQAGLTCDWWFNVRCSSTTQLYVLNESLYKYILPHSPKFPEDYSGPLVDKYLTLKFKEMEEEFNKNKKSKSESEKGDSDEDTDDESSEDESGKDTSVKSQRNTVSEASVVVETPGDSGKVERLSDD